MKNMVLRSFAMRASSSCWLVRACRRRHQANSKRPFDFAAGTAKLKAGDYIVKRMSDTPWPFVVLTEKRLR